jgi:hypothetical protein
LLGKCLKINASLTPARAAISLVFVPLKPFSPNKVAADRIILAFRAAAEIRGLEDFDEGFFI